VYSYTTKSVHCLTPHQAATSRKHNTQAATSRKQNTYSCVFYESKFVLFLWGKNLQAVARRRKSRRRINTLQHTITRCKKLQTQKIADTTNIFVSLSENWCFFLMEKNVQAVATRCKSRSFYIRQKLLGTGSLQIFVLAF